MLISFLNLPRVQCYSQPVTKVFSSARILARVSHFSVGTLRRVIPRNLLSRGLTCAVWLAVQTARAEYRFDVWTADSGLPRNSMGRILQSRDGYLWMTTLDGLVRFDGVRFIVFNKGNSPGLPSNRLTALYEDREGDLWVGTEDGSIARLSRTRLRELR